VSAVDVALVHGPGLRWSVAGAHLSYHLGGGEGGMKSYLERLGTSQERRWATLGDPQLTPEIRAALIAGVAEEVGELAVAQLEERRDRMLMEALQLRRVAGTIVGGGRQHWLADHFPNRQLNLF
jgi:carnitine 3-dehydrogenase